ncbi:MAG: hypothetical protein IH845_05830, partial [Nanoarchaeota archaeon]|nr:hypothetical protein [Nanoarchaeota archaeon]
KAGDASNIPTVDPESPTNEDPTERKPICNGCEFEDKCYPYGHRKSGKFCFDESNNFSNQSVGGSSCENNFECTTNVCVSGQCIKEGFIDKILNFFKRLFG